jgi:hypothetical protein
VSPGPAGTVDERLARVAQGVVRVQDFFWPPLPLEVLEASTSRWLRSRDAGGRPGCGDDGADEGGAPCPSR